MTTAKKTTKKTTKSHATKANHVTNEGDQTMKTGAKSSKSHEATAHVTNEGETNMKTSATETPSAIITNPATPSAAPVATQTTSPTVAGTLAYIQSCTSLLDQLEAAFPPGDSLTAKEKKHTAKARKGNERFAPQLVALAKQHGVNLSLVPLDAISNASAEATALVPLQKRFEALTARASSRLFTLQSATWSGSSKLYSVLKRLSKDSGDIETGLAPVEQFFNHRHPSVAKEHPKTKKGKAALAAEKAAAEAAAKPATTDPAVAPVAAPAATPVAAPVGAATHS